MSSNTQRTSKDKPRSLKCRHFCLPFDSHNYCPSCREANKGDDPCITLESPCEICASFSDEQMNKIKNRKRYVRKQQADTSRDNKLDLLGNVDVNSFTGSQADLEGATAQLFASPPRPQPLKFESLSLTTPAKSVPPTPGTALQQKIESKLEKCLGSQFNIQLQQQMGVFQASMLEAMKSLRDEFQSLKETSKGEVDQTSSASKPGTSKQPENLDPTPQRTQSSSRADEAVDVGLYGPSLPPHLGGKQSIQDSDPRHHLGDNQSMHESDPRHVSDEHSGHPEEPSRVVSTRPKKHADKRKHKVRSRYLSSEEEQSSVHTHRSSKPSRVPSDQDQPQHDPDPLFYREVAMADLPSQYAEEVETLRRILNLPDHRETMPRFSTSVLGLGDQKGQQELRPRGPSAMLPLSAHIKDAFDKFEHDFSASNLPEGKCIKPPPSTVKWFKVGQPCYEDKIQELNTDFSKISISPKPSGAPMGKVPLLVLKELEHQARQNLSTINFMDAFAKTLSSCNSTLEKCQHSLKSSFKKVKSQIQKGANHEKAARRGYEEACEYLELWNKTILIQQRALACLSKSLAHVLQRELYTMGNTGLLRREAQMTLLQPHLGDTRCQELRNSPLWPSSLFNSQLVKEGEDFLLKKAPLKMLKVLDPIKTSPFVVPTTRKEVPTGN